MITADTLARELGCTLADLADMIGVRLDGVGLLITRKTADLVRAEWSERTGIDYTVVIP